LLKIIFIVIFHFLGNRTVMFELIFYVPFFKASM